MSVFSRVSVPPNNASERLRKLSEEVSRIAATLSRLSLGTQQASDDAGDLQGNGRALSPDIVKQELKARRSRELYFNAELFADPAWDILLELLQAELCQYRVSVSSLCIAAHVPQTTALRWIATMTDLGLLRRRRDPRDARRIFIELTPRASDGMHRYFGNFARSLAA